MCIRDRFYTDENLEPQPCLVESYEIVSDTEWVFKLKQGVKFHNGQEMKAADVKASLELCKESVSYTHLRSSKSIMKNTALHPRPLKRPSVT